MTSALADRATAEREAERIIGAWSDPELWPPKGQGCWGCHLERAVAYLSHTALGFSCLSRWFPGWDEEQVMDWLIGQAERRVALEQAIEGRDEPQGRSQR